MSDPFGDDVPFDGACPECGELWCPGHDKPRRTLPVQVIVSALTGIIGLIVGILLGYVIFSGNTTATTPRDSSQPAETTLPTADPEPRGTTTTTTTAVATFSPANAEEQLMLDLVNQVRADNGVGPLSWCPALARSSLAHSQDMSARNYFEHDSPDGVEPVDRANEAGYDSGTVGENIAFGYRDTEEVMQGWIDSPGHFANLIEPIYEHLGSAFFDGRLDSSRGKFWTQNFGARGDCS